MAVVGAIAAVIDASAASASTTNAGDSLVIAVPFNNLGMAWPYIAQAEGYYKKVGLNVKIVADVGVDNATPLVLAGKADLTLLGVDSPVGAVAQGDSMQVIAGYTIDGIGGDLAVKSSSTTTTIQELSGARVGTVGAAGSAYGDTARLSKYVVDHGGKPFDIIPYETPATLLAAISSGQVAAGVGSPFYFGAAVAAKQDKYVINMASSASRLKYLGTASLPVNVFYGLKNTLARKRGAVVKFLEAMNMATRFLQTSSTQKIAHAVDGLASFKGVTAAENLSDAQTLLPFLYNTSTVISAAIWQKVLTDISFWNIDGFSATSKKFSYGSIVNMSYLKAADAG